MENSEIIKQIASTEFENEDEFKFKIELLPPVSEDELRGLRKTFPGQTINKELEDLLKITRGWEGSVYFDLIDHFRFEDLIANSICLCRDGFGNHWVLDLKPNGRLGKVFYVCHDPAVVVIQSNSLNEYLMHLLEFYSKPVKNTINFVHDESCMKIWNSKAELPSLRKFKKNNRDIEDSIKDYEGTRWRVADLRDGKIGMGFSWGMFGPDTQIVRVKELDIWLIEKKQKKRFGANLFWM